MRYWVTRNGCHGGSLEVASLEAPQLASFVELGLPARHPPDACRSMQSFPVRNGAGSVLRPRHRFRRSMIKGDVLTGLDTGFGADRDAGVYPCPVADHAVVADQRPLTD